MSQFFYNFNLLNNLFYNLPSNQTVELLNSYFVTASLTLLIVISLVLTFHSKGTAIHKVLGLLLLSIFVVFLWMFQTQFLFIYLVYILAFISAVLMLFLSVVLMLPVSTLTSNNTKVNSSVFLIVPSLLDVNYNFAMLCLFEGFIILVILYVINTRKYSFGEIKKMFAYLSRQLEVFSLASSRSTFNFEKFVNDETNISWDKKNQYNSVISFLKKFSLVNYLITWFQQQKLEESAAKRILYYGFMVALYIFALSVILVAQFGEVVWKTIITSAEYTKYLVANAGKMLTTMFDSFVQFYLFLNVLIIAFSVNFLNMMNYNNLHKEFNSAVEHVQGLGVLKGFLYDQYGSFLIISTLVLLIALIGAAVMTKNNKTTN